MYNKSQFEEFLFNPEYHNYIYIDNNYLYESQSYYKEKFNHRFYLIYEKYFRADSMDGDNYNCAGYFDCINRVLYRPSYKIRNMIEKNNVCIISSFEDLDKKIEEEVQTKFLEYVMNHELELKELAIQKFNDQEDYYYKNLKKDVEQEFIKNDSLLEIPLNNFSARNTYEREFKFSNKLIYTEYLDFPKQTISKICDSILKIEEEKEKLGMLLLIKDYKNNYLQEIIENQDSQFENIYINKRLYQSIKDIDAINFNITICYDKEEITFKFSKSRLIMELKENSLGTSDWGKAYEPIKDFLEKHKDKNDYYSKEKFDFSNITKITYGKNIIYEKQEYKEKNENLIDYEIEKDITESMF